jgi:hypothetical protein
LQNVSRFLAHQAHMLQGGLNNKNGSGSLMRSIAFPSSTSHRRLGGMLLAMALSLRDVVQSSLDSIIVEESHPHRDWSLSSEVTSFSETVLNMLNSFQDKLVQWRNLTLFLAAFGGVCVLEDHDPSALVNVVPAQYLPDEMRVLQNPMSMMSTFITDLTDLLIADSVRVRDVARDALGI